VSSRVLPVSDGADVPGAQHALVGDGDFFLFHAGLLSSCALDPPFSANDAGRCGILPFPHSLSFMPSNVGYGGGELFYDSYRGLVVCSSLPFLRRSQV